MGTLVGKRKRVTVRNQRGDVVWHFDLTGNRVYDPQTGKYYHARHKVEQGTVVITNAIGTTLSAYRLKPGETVEIEER